MSDSESSTSSVKAVPVKRKRNLESDQVPEEDDASALSHAEKRRQRKKEKLLGQEGGSETNKSKGEGNNKKESSTTKDTAAHPAKEKRQNSVWVGNMSFKTTVDDIKQFFADVGEPTRIHMPTKAATRPNAKLENRGFAYVDFATPALRDAAIAKSEQPLVGRRLLIKDGSSFEGRPAAATEGTDTLKSSSTHSKTAQNILKAQKQPPGPTLFLGNLGFNTTEASIMELFNAHRKKPRVEQEGGSDQNKQETQENKTGDWMRKVRMGTFEDSGLCKGFAFVDFTTTEHATSVLINPKNHHLDGRKLVVEYASPDAVRRGGGPRPKGFINEHSNSKGKDDSTKKRKHDDAMDIIPAHEDAEKGKEEARPKKVSKAQRPHSRPHGDQRSRPKPGAALALAKRESAAIVPAAGKKIVF